VAIIKTCIEPKMGSAVIVKLDVATSVGTMVVNMTFPDQGSAAANEMLALRRFQTWLNEAQQALKDHEAW
jgi:hypothetical protein